jgi:hypothetical protein
VGQFGGDVSLFQHLGAQQRVEAPANGIELRRNTRKPNRRRAQRAEVKAAGVVACSELLAGAHSEAPCLGFQTASSEKWSTRSARRDPAIRGPTAEPTSAAAE